MSLIFRHFIHLCIFSVSLGLLQFPSIWLDLSLKEKKIRNSYVQHIK